MRREASKPSLLQLEAIKINSQKAKKNVELERGGAIMTTMTVELDLERMEKMKQGVLKVIQGMIDEYGKVSVIELELALIEGLVKVREIGIKQMEESDEESDVV
jgi:hypothetical protein